MLADSGIEAGLGSEERVDCCGSRWRNRFEKMDGDERKSGSKKRPKQIDVGLGSGGDEPIGSLLKLKKPQNPKKGKAGSKKGVVKGKKAGLEDEGLGEMDDTLASLWKKLKVSKKDSVSGTGDSDVKSALRGAEKDPALCNGGSDVTTEIGAENKPKGKTKRPNTNLNVKKNDGGSESMGSGCSLVKDKNASGVVGEEDTSHHSSDDHLEDSLSLLFRKVHSGLAKKSRANSGVKEDHETGRGRHSSVESMRSNDKEQARLSQQPSTAQEGLIIDPCSSDKVYDTESMPCTSFPHVDNSLSPEQKAALKNCISKDGAKQHPSECEMSSSVVATLPVHDVDLQNNECKKSSEEIDSHECLKGAHHAQPFFSCYCNSQKMGESCTNCEGRNTHAERADLASGPLAAESLGTHIDNNQAVIKSTSVQSQDCISGGKEETRRDSPPSGSPDEDESYFEDTVSKPDSGNRERRLSANREMRKPKKRRHRDMAYEGDADWEKLVDDQAFQDRQHALDGDRSVGARVKFDVEGGGVAAVSAGLKARAVGPVEKIKFKEVLKRRGGLQDYLECRNQILSFWNKDVSRILPLSDCGVAESASADESTRASLIREIYAFLDQSGYINFGIASEKDKAQFGSKQHYKLREKLFAEGSGVSVADSEDGVSFIIGQINSSKATNDAKDGVISIIENQTQEVVKGSECVTNVSLEAADVVEPEGSCEATENCSIDAKLSDRLANLDVGNTEPSSKMLDVGQFPIITAGIKEESSADDDGMRNAYLQCGIDDRKKIIVIGAGPAGLTAARHLQRQGFSVTVLEARHRIGGRVYTDRSSLSVPVDLGASIITGVEADVDTERRPDPSSLICAQLGLELTILKSDCPLYDSVTAQKVPSDLDEALEAEYNSLLDDMILLVAQKGEHAMKMSLEEGLEYALEKRRRARLGVNAEEKQQNNASDGFVDHEANSDGGVPMINCASEELLSPLERRVMDWHFANLEYGCAALLKEVSLPYWNQDDVYGGFGGAHCMIKGGYSAVVESLGEGLSIHLNHVVTDVSYNTKVSGDGQSTKVSVTTSNGGEFLGEAVLVTVPLGCLKAETIKFSPPLPQWKHSSVQRLGFGVLNKVVMEFPDVFWDDSVDYFGATAEETDLRGQCFMFWNLRKTVGAPVLIALLVGKAAIDGQRRSSSDHVNHALVVLRQLFGEKSVPDPVASVVTDWGGDPFSYGAYSYVAVGASGEDYDILGRPVENCLFFAGEATCKEHPDTVGGAMMSGLREAVRIIHILTTGNDYTEEVETMEALQRQSESERDEVRDIARRLDAVELSNALYKDSLDGTKILTMEALLQEMFFNAKTNAGRLHLVKEFLHLPTETLKSFAGTKEGLSTLNAWILDSMGKDGTQLLRHCVRLLVLVSTDLLAVRLSGIGKTVKEKVCVHTSRDIRAIASQLVNVWLEVFRREKASSGALKFSRQSASIDSAKRKSFKDSTSGKPPLHTNHGAVENRGTLQVSASNANVKKVNGKVVKLESPTSSVLDVEEAMTEEEKAAIAAAEAAHAAALAAAEAYASSEAKSNTLLQLPKIPSFHKFVRREHVQPEEYDHGKKWPGSAFGRPDCVSEIDSRNCRVRDWSVDFSATCINLDDGRISADNLSQRSHSNDIASHLNFREHSGESAAADSSIYTKAWVDTAGSEGIKDHHAIERWQSQAAAADSNFFYPAEHIRDEEDSNASSRQPMWKYDGRVNESSVSHVTVNKESVKGHHRGAERIKQAVVDYVASLLMPLYKAKKIDKEGYKSIMKKSATKVMEQATDVEKAMAVSQFLDYKRKNKIRAFVDKLIERHMASKPTVNRDGPGH